MKTISYCSPESKKNTLEIDSKTNYNVDYDNQNRSSCYSADESLSSINKEVINIIGVINKSSSTQPISLPYPPISHPQPSHPPISTPSIQSEQVPSAPISPLPVQPEPILPTSSPLPPPPKCQQSQLSHTDNSYDYFSAEHIHFIDNQSDYTKPYHSAISNTPLYLPERDISITNNPIRLEEKLLDNQIPSRTVHPNSIALSRTSESGSIDISIVTPDPLISLNSKQVKGLQGLTSPKRTGTECGIITRVDNPSTSKSPSTCSLVDSLDVLGSSGTTNSPSLISHICGTSASTETSDNKHSDNSICDEIIPSNSEELNCSTESNARVSSNQYFIVEDPVSEEITIPCKKHVCLNIEENIEKQSVNFKSIEEIDHPSKLQTKIESDPQIVDISASMEDHVARVTRYVDGCIEEAIRFHASTPRSSLSSCASISSAESAIVNNSRIGEIYTSGEYTGLTGPVVGSGDNDSTSDFYALVDTVRGVGMQPGEVCYSATLVEDNLVKDMTRTCSTGNTSTAVLHDLSSCGSSEGDSCRQRRLLMEGSSGSSENEDGIVDDDNIVDGLSDNDRCDGDDGEGDDGYCTLAHVMRSNDRNQHTPPTRTASNLSMLVNVDPGELESLATASVFGTIEDGDEEAGVFDDNAIQDSSQSGGEDKRNVDSGSNEEHEEVNLTEKERRQVRFSSLEQSDGIELVGEIIDSNNKVVEPIHPTSQRMQTCGQRRRSFQDTRVTGFDVAPENQQLRAAIRAKQRQSTNEDRQHQQHVSTYAYRNADIQVLGLQPSGSVPKRTEHLPSRHCVSSLDILINPLSCSDSEARSGNASESDSDLSSNAQSSIDRTDNIAIASTEEYTSCKGCNWKESDQGIDNTITQHPLQCKLGQSCSRIISLERLTYPIDRELSFSLSLSGSHIPLVNDQSESHRARITVMNRSTSQDRSIEECSDIIVTSSSRMLDSDGSTACKIDQKCQKHNSRSLGNTISTNSKTKTGETTSANRPLLVDDQTQTIDLSKDVKIEASRDRVQDDDVTSEGKRTSTLVVNTDSDSIGMSSNREVTDGKCNPVLNSANVMLSDIPSSDTFFTSSSSSSSSSSYTYSDERHIALREQLALSTYTNRAGRIRILDETTDSCDASSDSEDTSSSSAEGNYRYVPIETTHQELLQGIATLVMGDYDEEEEDGTSDESSVDPEEWSEDELDAQDQQQQQQQPQQRQNLQRPLQEQQQQQQDQQEQQQLQHQQLQQQQLAYHNTHTLQQQHHQLQQQQQQQQQLYRNNQSYDPLQRPNRPTTAHRPILTNGPISHESMSGWHNGVNGLAESSRLDSGEEDESLGGEYGNSTVEPVYHHRVRSTNGEVDTVDSDEEYEEDLVEDDDDDGDDDEELVLMFNIATQTTPLQPRNAPYITGSLNISNSTGQQTSPRGIAANTQTTPRQETSDTQTVLAINVADTQTSPRNTNITTQTTPRNTSTDTQTTPRIHNIANIHTRPVISICDNQQTVSNTIDTQTTPRNTICDRQHSPTSILATEDIRPSFCREDSCTQTSATPVLVDTAVSASPPARRSPSIFSSSESYSCKPPTPRIVVSQNEPAVFGEIDSVEVVTREVGVSPVESCLVGRGICVSPREVGAYHRDACESPKEACMSTREASVSSREVGVSPREKDSCYRQCIYHHVDGIQQPICRTISLEAEPLPDDNYVHEEEITVEELTLNLDLITGDSSVTDNKDVGKHLCNEIMQ